MIVTITMNPSVDISYPIENFKEDTVNRVVQVTKTAGGKGLNVTRVLQQMGADVTASGLIGGFLGEQIKSELDEKNISHTFTQIKDETRNCIAILHEGMQTEILESGPVISKEEATQFLDDFSILIEKAEIITFSGSLPSGLPKDFYVEMIEKCHQQQKPVVLDCSGESLKAVLNSSLKPLLIKPNTEELADLLGVEVAEDIETIKSMLKSSVFAGVEWIAVSMGSKGMIAKHHEFFYHVEIPKIIVVNPVGSGDSTVAGLAYGISQRKHDEEILKIANVLGMLNAQEATTGLVNLDNFDRLSNQIKVTQF